MIDLKSQIHIGIQNVHNLTGDFVRQFAGTVSAECPINPSIDGITFFRDTGSHKPEQQAQSFAAIDTVLSDVGGLDAVVLIAKELGDSLSIAKAVKQLSPKIPTILLSSRTPNLLASNSERVFKQAIPPEVADAIRETTAHFKVHDGTTDFWTFAQASMDDVASLKAQFELVDDLDTLVFSGMSIDTDDFTPLLQRPLTSISNGAFDNRAIREAYKETYPALAEFEKSTSSPNSKWADHTKVFSLP